MAPPSSGAAEVPIEATSGVVTTTSGGATGTVVATVMSGTWVEAAGGSSAMASTTRVELWPAASLATSIPASPAE